MSEPDYLPAWRYDPTHRTLDLRFTFNGAVVHAWIEPRPRYCDRGHWKFNASGPFPLDGADSFPRYFMSLDAAIAEAEAWLRWRLVQLTRTPNFPPLLIEQDGRAFTLSA